MTDHVLEVQDLHVHHRGRRRRDQPVHAVNGVSLRIAAGETLGLVGESGSGKSTLGGAVLGLVQPTAGRILFRGRDITRATSKERRELSRSLQVIFQDPYGSLNPSRSVGNTLSEPLRLGHGLSRRDAKARVHDVLMRVGMPPDAAERFPAEFSGGQRQRIAIARALVMEPELIVCDEPTSALDLSIQAQILNLLLHLQERFGLSYLFISHDIDVVRHVSHRAAVMYRGEIVEAGPTSDVTEHPVHDYTKTLIKAVPTHVS